MDSRSSVWMDWISKIRIVPEWNLGDKIGYGLDDHFPFVFQFSSFFFAPRPRVGVCVIGAF